MMWEYREYGGGSKMRTDRIIVTLLSARNVIHENVSK